jgi:4-hydroxy-3-polyprenylbenzoate decarboxylase
MADSYNSLREFMDLLESRNLLQRVKTSVSPVLEMTEIHRRVLADGGPALLFENVDHKSKMPALTNLFGTVERVALGMGKTPDQLREIGETLAFLRQPEPPSGWREAFDMLPLARQVMAMKPKTTSKAACQQIILKGDEVDLETLPIHTCWPGEQAPLIMWG